MKFCPTCNNKYDDGVSFCPKDGEVLEEDPTSFVGSVLDGQYQIESLLGKGGMGAVYRARHILLGDRVAIKLLPPQMRSNTEWLRRFQREGQAARRFRHPNAVTVYDLRTSSDGMIYLVMEYVEGTTLDAELKRHGRFSPAEALNMLKPVMSVLNAAHSMGVVHRDLKPENIMIGKAGTSGEPTVKLLDLGIAKLREVAGGENTGSTVLTVAGQMLGTPYYMSPEQWGELPNDGNSEIDGRADLYSLGVVFYELIAGNRPFSGLTLLELRKQHVSATPKPLREIVPGVSEAFSRAIARSIAKDRSQRQSTAAELEAELAAALSDDGAAVSVSPDFVTESERPSNLATVAERPTPTMGDAGALTVVEGGPQAPVPSASGSQAPTMPTVLVSAEEIAAREAARPKESGQAMPKQQVEIAIPSRRRSPLLVIGAIAVALLMLVGGGYAVMKFMRSPASNVSSTSPPSSADSVIPMHEVGRYWLEVHPADVNPKTKLEKVLAGDSLIMHGKTSFRFHFSPNDNGYIYIIGATAVNIRIIYLSTQPGPKSGLRTNEVKSGLEFTFPAQTTTVWISLVETPGIDEFIFVFSKVPLTSPEFFAGISERALTPDEEKQLTDFLDQHKKDQVVTEPIKNGAFPMVAVKVAQNGPENASVIFRTRIQHN
jgi:serine/threonine protein kinase